MATEPSPTTDPMDRPTDDKIPPTVGQVIEALQKLPSDTRVLVSGYEGGFEGADLSMAAKPFKRNPQQKWYYGRWEECKPGDSAHFVGVIL